VLGAVSAVNTEIRDLLRGRSWGSLAEADQAMIDLDGTATKSRLGANATVGTSMALARALAASAGIPLWQWITPDGVPPSLPVPHFNVLNGGVHAPNALDFQEFMVAPVGAPSMAEAVRAGAEVYSALRRELSGRKLSTGLGDEGGFAPEITEPEEVLRLRDTTELVGDDIFCTNPAIITRAIARGIGNAALIKLNQIGTVTETLQAMAICRQAGYRQFVSHRSGETEDHFIADLAVGTGS